MVFLHLIIPAFWIAFVVCWLISARFAKRSVGGRAKWKHIAIRFCILVLIVIAVSSATLRHGVRVAQAYQASHALMAATGIVVTALGLALAVWARIRLGRNWGTPMSQREDPELIIGGPYAYVRHPIYS